MTQKEIESNFNVYKFCFVPGCKNTVITAPTKVFIQVPANTRKRKLWCEAVGYQKEKLRKVSFCCEDHFDLKNDMENYMQWKMMGSPKVMKDTVVPHLALNVTTEPLAQAIAEEIQQRQKKKLDNVDQNISKNVSSQIVIEPLCSNLSLMKEEEVILTDNQETPNGPENTKDDMYCSSIIQHLNHTESKPMKSEETNKSNSVHPIEAGKRLIDLNFFFDQLPKIFGAHAPADTCECRIGDLEYIGTQMFGLKSLIYFRCKKCTYSNNIWSESVDYNTYMNVNGAVIAGTITNLSS